MIYPNTAASHPKVADRDRAIMWARRLTQSENWCIIDTETTGKIERPLTEIIQIGILAADGTVLLDEMIKPELPIPAEVTAIHGITDAMVAGCPRFRQVLSRIDAAIRRCRNIVIYNVQFDRGLLGREILRVLGDGADVANWIGCRNWSCAMKMYAQFVGETGRYGDYKWHRLANGEGDAHTAISDCRAVLKIIHDMAEARLSTETDIHGAFREAQSRMASQAAGNPFAEGYTKDADAHVCSDTLQMEI